MAGDGLEPDDEFSGTQSPFERAVIMAGLCCLMVILLPFVAGGIWGEILGVWDGYMCQWQWDDWYVRENVNDSPGYAWLTLLGALGGFYNRIFRQSPAGRVRFGLLFLAACLFYWELIVIGNDRLIHAFWPALGVTAGCLCGHFLPRPASRKPFGVCLLLCLLSYGLVAIESHWLSWLWLPFLGALGGLYYSDFRRELPARKRLAVLSVLAVLVYTGVIVIGCLCLFFLLIALAKFYL